jgi:hypothetical protein
MSERSDDLLGQYLEGDLDASGTEELDRLLETDPEEADRAALLYTIHRGLGLLHQEKDPALFARSTMERLRGDREAFVGAVRDRLGPARPRRSWLGYVGVSAATLLLSLSVQLALVKNPEAPPAGPVATLLRADKAHWEPEGTLASGQRLSPGPLRLSSGTALLLFDGGAMAAVEGPADFEILSRGRALLRQGHVLARCEGEAAGFSLTTPAGEVVDLGTEFVVSVEKSGATELHVQKGEVSWSPGSGKPGSQVVMGGQAMRFENADAKSARPIPFMSESLDDTLRQLSYGLEPSRPTAQEDFEYAPGDRSPEGAAGGTGWVGSWRFRKGVEATREPDRPGVMRIAGESLSGTWSTGPERGGALTLPPGYSVFLRELADPLDLGQDAVYYVGFALRRELDGPIGSSQYPHFRLTLRSSADYWGPAISAGLPLSRRPTLQFRGHDSYVSTATVAPGEATYWVMKIVAGRSRPDEIFLKVYGATEAMPAFEPAAWTTSTGPLSTSGKLDLVVLTGTGPTTHVVDGLRVGRTWESVTRKD